MTGSHLPTPPLPFLSRSERILLQGLPGESHSEMLPLLRSRDPAVRAMALVLIHLDREEAVQDDPTPGWPPPLGARLPGRGHDAG